MDFTFLSQVNYPAVFTAAIIFFLCGSLWYSALFGAVWVQELEKHNVMIKQPTTGDLMLKMILTFACNIVTAIGMAYFVIATNASTALAGLQLGLIATLGFAATTLGATFIWQSRSLKLFLIDIGYPALGIIASGVLLAVWR